MSLWMNCHTKWSILCESGRSSTARYIHVRLVPGQLHAFWPRLWPKWSTEKTIRVQTKRAGRITNDKKAFKINQSISLSTYLSICLSIYSPLLDPGRFFSFLILYTVGNTPWTRDQPVAMSLPTYRTTQTHNKRTQTSMSWVEFEHTIPAFERAKTVHALDCAATVIGFKIYTLKWKHSFDFVNFKDRTPKRCCQNEQKAEFRKER
jgi:hypothetical protein